MASDTPSPRASVEPTARPAIAWRQILWFCVITFGLTWLIILPLYFINDPAVFQLLYLPLTLLMMGVPGLIAWLVVRRQRPKGQRAAALGFQRPRRLPRFLGYLAIAFFLPIVIGLVSIPLAVALGLFDTDFTNFSGLQETFAAAGVTGMPIEVILLTQAINIVIASWLINLLPALGEEIGWRGWLTPQLLPLGALPTIGITGVIWGLWHTPVMLLGHNYPHLPGWLSVSFMVIFCTLIGGVLSWLSIRSNSVWPAALGHSTINATAALPLLFSATPSFDSAAVGIAGATGWIVTAVILVVLVVTQSFRPARIPEPDPTAPWSGDHPQLEQSTGHEQ